MFLALTIIVVLIIFVVFMIGGKRDKEQSMEKGTLNKLRRQYEGQAVFLAKSIEAYKKPLQLPEGVKFAIETVDTVASIATIVDPDSSVTDVRVARDDFDKPLFSEPKQKKAIPTNAYSIKGMPTTTIKPGTTVSLGGVATPIVAIFHNKSSSGFGAASSGQIVEIIIQAPPTMDINLFNSQLSAQQVMPLVITA
jgi:hypothetical protein